MRSQVTFDYGIFSRPFPGERYSGDLIVVKEAISKSNEEFDLIVTLDILGHGVEAYKHIPSIQSFLIDNDSVEPLEILKILDSFLSDKNGCAGSVCKIDRRLKLVNWAALGNVHARIWGKEELVFVSSDGIIGQRYRAPKLQTSKIEDGDLLIIATDGVSSRFHVQDYPEWKSFSTKGLASKIVDLFGSHSDDSTCLVARIHD